MQSYLTLTRRELASYFVSWIGYVIIAAAAFLIGLSYVALLGLLRLQASPVPVTEVFYATDFFWLIMLPAAPVITMRVFALEKSSGTFETLMTTPVGDLQVVLAKFTAALVFYFAMWTPLLGCTFSLRYFTHDPSAWDPGALGGTMIGIVLLGCLFLSVGCLGSALTRNQIVAVMISSAGVIGLFMMNWLLDRVELSAGWLGQAAYCVALVDHMQDFARGVVDTRAVVFCLSLTAFFLFLTLRVVESRRWR